MIPTLAAVSGRHAVTKSVTSRFREMNSGGTDIVELRVVEYQVVIQ